MVNAHNYSIHSINVQNGTVANLSKSLELSIMNDQEIKISKLKRHPFQDSVYLREPDLKIQNLADDMEKNGQRVPIEVTQKYVIIDGHCRIEAAKELGWEKILAVVIEVNDDAETRRRHLEANVNRRHLEKIDHVRLIKANLELEYEGKSLHPDKLRERIAQAFGQDKGEPTVRRYTRLVMLNDLIQEKFKLKQLRLMTAIKFDTLDESKQKELLKLIEREEMSPSEAFDQFFPNPKAIPVEPDLDSSDEEGDSTSVEIESEDLPPQEAILQLAEYILEDATSLL